MPSTALNYVPPKPEKETLAEREPPSKRYLAEEVIADKYKLVRKLGTGGMGEVWVARNLALEVDVAIKLIRAEANNPVLAERLMSEARLAARLGHRAIIRVFDFGKTSHSDPFIVMEYLDGETLGERIEREERVQPIDAARMLLPIIDALDVAHQKNIVHRDMKPDNIFLAVTEGGQIQPKVLDFGIAKLEHSDLKNSKLTQEGTLVGSPYYMSPEQAKGLADLDYRSDIWALSVVFYEVITGRMPFDGDNYNALLRSIIEEPAKPIVELGIGDSGLWAIIERGLSKQPEARWVSMRQMGEAIAGWLDSHGVSEDICAQSLKASWLKSGNNLSPRYSGEVPVYRLSDPGQVTAGTEFSVTPDSGVPAESQPRIAQKGVKIGVGIAVLAVAVALWLGLRAPAQSDAQVEQAAAAARPPVTQAEPAQKAEAAAAQKEKAASDVEPNAAKEASSSSATSSSTTSSSDSEQTQVSSPSTEPKTESSANESSSVNSAKKSVVKPRVQRRAVARKPAVKKTTAASKAEEPKKPKVPSDDDFGF